jgi:hypothetical protein
VRREYHRSLGHKPVSDPELLSWYRDQKLLQNPESLYSDALNLIGDTPRQRRDFLSRFFDRAKPGSTHRAIASLVAGGFITTIFTTNFDSLIEQAIREDARCRTPKVAAHEDDVRDVLISENSPTLLKLHGDYLFSDIKNTERETAHLKKNMRDKLRHFLAETGLVVIGYSGGDTSVMALLEQMAYDGRYFPYGIYWVHLTGSSPSPRVDSFVRKGEGQFLPVDGAELYLEHVAERLEMESHAP